MLYTQADNDLRKAVTTADNRWRNDTARAWGNQTTGDLVARGNVRRTLANTSNLVADKSQASIAELKAQWWQGELPNYLQWSVDVGAIETTYTNSTTANTLSRATGVKNAGVTYASTVGTAIQTYETTTAAARAQYLSSVMSLGETAAEAKLKAGRDKEIALANADLQKQLTGNETAYATAVNKANSAYDTATTSADAVLKSAKQTALSQLNSALAQSSKDKDTAIAGAERTYDQLVAALDAQYGSLSSNGDTGIEGARRQAAISTRDAQYYASRDTSWAGTLSGSATIGNTPWTLKAIASANAQAAYSTNRARAQAAHDAALLSAMNDWRESSSAAYLKSLVSSSRAENDFKSSVAGFWADWNMATEGNDRGTPTGFLGSVTDSVMGLMNPFDTDSIARSLTTETKADTTNGPQRPKPSDIHVVYSIYGIVSEHTPEEWEVIREYQTKGRTWEEWMMGGERKRMDAAGFKTSFRKLEEDVPPAKVLATPTVPSPPPAVPAVSNPILTPLDANNELMVSRDDFDLDITDTILGIIGGTRGDYIDESFNFLYGVGDNMSLGLGWWLRSTFFHDQADYGGSSYYIGGWVGFAGDLLMGVGAFKALGKTFGREALESGLRNAPSSVARGGSGTNRWWFDMPEGVPPNGPSRFGDDFRNIWRDNPDMPAFSPMTGRHAGEIGVRPDMSSRARQFWYDHEFGHAALTNALRFNSLQKARQGWYNLNGIFTGAEEAIVHGRAVYLNTNSLRMALSEGARYPFEAITGAGQRYVTLRGVGTEVIVGAGIAGWINFFWQDR